MAIKGSLKEASLPDVLQLLSMGKKTGCLSVTHRNNFGSIYFDKGKKVLGALDVSVLPTSILIDTQGRELGRLEGDADWDKPEALALMKAAVDNVR